MMEAARIIDQVNSELITGSIDSAHARDEWRDELGKGAVARVATVTQNKRESVIFRSLQDIGESLG